MPRSAYDTFTGRYYATAHPYDGLSFPTIFGWESSPFHPKIEEFFIWELNFTDWLYSFSFLPHTDVTITLLPPKVHVGTSFGWSVNNDGHYATDVVCKIDGTDVSSSTILGQQASARNGNITSVGTSSISCVSSIFDVEEDNNGGSVVVVDPLMITGDVDSDTVLAGEQVTLSIDIINTDTSVNIPGVFCVFESNVDAEFIDSSAGGFDCNQDDTNTYSCTITAINANLGLHGSIVVTVDSVANVDVTATCRANVVGSSTRQAIVSFSVHPGPATDGGSESSSNSTGTDSDGTDSNGTDSNGTDSNGTENTSEDSSHNNEGRHLAILFSTLVLSIFF